MTAAGNKVQDHYASEGIAARILAALRAAGGSEAGPITPDALAPLDEVILDARAAVVPAAARKRRVHQNLEASVFLHPLRFRSGPHAKSATIIREVVINVDTLRK